ncbi:hypothetical protein U1Q18_000539 [Sarracenia purpurea var. burkii]
MRQATQPVSRAARFFSASLFSLEGIEFAPPSSCVTRAERISPIFLRPDIMATSIDEVSSNAKPLVRQMRESPNRVKKLVEMLPQQEGTPLAVALI